MPLKEAAEKTETGEEHGDDSKVKYVTVHYSRALRSGFYPKLIETLSQLIERILNLKALTGLISDSFFYSRDQVQVTNLPQDGAVKEYSVLANQP